MPKSNTPDLEPLLGRRVRVGLRDGRELIGMLEGYDAYTNIVLRAIENAPAFGEGVVRGDAIVSIRECR